MVFTEYCKSDFESTRFRRRKTHFAQVVSVQRRRGRQAAPSRKVVVADEHDHTRHGALSGNSSTADYEPADAVLAAAVARPTSLPGRFISHNSTGLATYTEL